MSKKKGCLPGQVMTPEGKCVRIPSGRKPAIHKIKYNKSIGRPIISGYQLVKITKDDAIAKNYATKLLDYYPDRFVTHDFREDNNGNILVYMVKWGAFK